MSNVIAELQQVIDRLLPHERRLKVLEAGCGSKSYISLGRDPYIVGIDNCESQLVNNNTIQEKILGDIQTYPLPHSQFDVIVCWDVLEHLSKPELALDNFARTIADEGVIVLAVPNVFSLKGIVAKFTPYKFHRLLYRTIFGSKMGAAGYEPFPTFLRFSIAPKALEEFAQKNDLTVEYLKVYESGFHLKLRKKYGLVGWKWAVIRGAARLFSFGKIDAEATDVLILLRKSAAKPEIMPAAMAGVLA